MAGRGGPRSGDGMVTQTRRRFLRATGLMITGGTAAVGLPPALPEAPAVSSRAADGVIAGARRLSYRAVAETVAALRGSDRGRDVSVAEERMVAWYAEAAPAERAEIDGALDAVTEVLGALKHPAEDAGDRAADLAKHLAGPNERLLTSAIGLAVSGLGGERSKPADVYSAGRLYARLIRVLPTQHGPGRASGPGQVKNQPEPCSPGPS